MAAPSFGAVGTLLEGTSSSANVPVPSGVANGSVVVVYMYVDGDSVTVSALPSGFAHVTGSPYQNPGGGGAAGSHKLVVAWKRATGNDTGTYNFTLSGSTYRAARCVRYANVVSSGDPWDFVDFNHTTSEVSVTPAASGTTLGADRLLVWCGTNWAGGTWTPPSAGGTWTERFDSGDGAHSGADRVMDTQDATGDVTGTCTGSDKSIGFLGALIGTTVGPVFEAVGTAVSSASGTACDIDVPAGVVNNSVVVAYIYHESTGIATVPSGFSLVPGFPITAQGFTLTAYWKRATTTESSAGTYGFVLNTSAAKNAVAVRYAGTVNSGDPWESDTDSGNNSTGTAFSTLSVSTATANTLLCWFGATFSFAAKTPPTSFTERFDASECIALADLLQTATGSSGSVIGSTTNNAAKQSWLGALKSSAASDATVNASVIAAVAAFPTATKSTGSTVSPSTITAVAALPAATAQGGAGVAPSVIAAVAAFPSGEVRTGSTVSPATIAAVAALPAATVETGSNATVTPGVIAAVAAFPAGEVRTGSTVSPAVVAAAASFPAAGPSTGSTVSPSAVAAVAAFPAAVVQTGGGVEIHPDPIAVVAGFPAAAVSVGVTLAPATIAAVAAFPAATIVTGGAAAFTRIGGVLVGVSLRGVARIGGASVPFS